MTNAATALIKVEDLFGIVELQSRPVRDGNRMGNQWRKITRDKHGTIAKIGNWDGPYVWMEFST
jgi:hypothetical protein